MRLRAGLLCFAVVTGVVHAAPKVVPGDRLPQDVLDRIIKRYDAPYITFDAEIVTYISVRSGFILVPEEQIAPGTVFKVVMSRRGDVRYDLFVQGKLRFTYQVAVKDAASSNNSRPLPHYLVTETDHVGKVIRSARADTELETYSGVHLADEVYDDATWCSSGGYVRTHLGPNGKVADDYVEELKKGRVVSGPSTDGRELYRVKIVRMPRTADEAGLYLFITVDAKRGLILEIEFQVHHPGQSPKTFRLKRFKNIRFPKVLKDDYDVFGNIPEAARSFRRWKEKAPEENTDQKGEKK